MALAALPIPAVAERLAVSHMTVRRLIAKRRLRAYQVGRSWRIEPDDLEAFIEERRARAGRTSTEPMVRPLKRAGRTMAALPAQWQAPWIKSPK